MTGETIVVGVIAGAAATVTMDLLAAASRRSGLTAGTKAQWIGRWFLSVVRGRIVHPDITTAREQPREVRAALLGHYAIGVVLGVLYLSGTGWLGVPASSFPVALGYGFATNVFPWLLMFPAMGFGLLGLKGPPESRLFVSSLMNHLYYGLGLWWSTLLLGS